MSAWKKCNEDCFHCPYEDCIKPEDKCHDEATREIEDYAQLGGYTDDIVSDIRRERYYHHKYSEHHKEYMKQYHKGIKDGTRQRKRPYKRRVIQYSFDGEKVAEYESVAEASRIFGGKQRMIGKAARGDNQRGRKHGAYGFDWRYA